jgi:hypothetical protein
MELEYSYENHAWGYVHNIIIIKSNGDVYYNNLVSGDKRKICKLTNKVTNDLFLNASQIKDEPYLVNSGRAFDAGEGNFYLIKSNKKILIQSDGNHQLQSTNQNVIYVVSLFKKIINIVSKHV